MVSFLETFRQKPRPKFLIKKIVLNIEPDFICKAIIYLIFFEHLFKKNFSLVPNILPLIVRMSYELRFFARGCAVGRKPSIYTPTDSILHSETLILVKSI